MELSTPLTLYWDLPEEDLPFVAPLMDELGGIPFLTIHLTAWGPLPETLVPLLDDPSILPGKRIHLTLPLSRIAGRGTLPLRPAVFYAAVGSEEEIDRLTALVADSSRLGVSLPADSPRTLPRLIRHACERGIHAVHLPILRAASGETGFFLREDDLTAVGRGVAGEPFPPALRLLVHDPFLWRALHPGGAGWTGGCQGGNTLIHLDREGTVRGCPLIPEPLGSLRTDTLRGILDGARRRTLREKVTELPALCLPCPLREGCHGGCRGRAFLAGFPGSPDPCCPHLQRREVRSSP